jgi:hypothetical protein
MVNNHGRSSIRIEVCEGSFLDGKHVEENDIVFQAEFFQDNCYFPWVWRVWERWIGKLDIVSVEGMTDAHRLSRDLLVSWWKAPSWLISLLKFQMFWLLIKCQVFGGERRKFKIRYLEFLRLFNPVFSRNSEILA